MHFGRISYSGKIHQDFKRGDFCVLKTLFCAIIMMVQIGWGCLSSDAIAFDLKMLGLRGGISDHRNEEDFTQYEGFATWNLPWTWKLASNWSLTTYIEANAGLLKGGGNSAFVGSIGPGIYFSGFNDRISILMGVNPTVISKHTFGDEDLGGPIQFTSHIGVDFNFVRHFAIGYRFQHMSNFVFYDPNPGLNLHMIEIGYLF
jgi:hypothetical protein